MDMHVRSSSKLKKHHQLLPLPVNPSIIASNSNARTQHDGHRFKASNNRREELIKYTQGKRRCVWRHMEMETSKGSDHQVYIVNFIFRWDDGNSKGGTHVKTSTSLNMFFATFHTTSGSTRKCHEEIDNI